MHVAEESRRRAWDRHSRPLGRTSGPRASRFAEEVRMHACFYYGL